MKRVLILNGDSFVGIHVAKRFFHSREYDVEVTLSARDDDLVGRAASSEGTGASSISSSPDRRAKLSDQIPAELLPYVKAVVPRHNEDPKAFCRHVLENDVIIAVLEDDSYEAECAIKMLYGTHYDVEKTYVLVSSVLTWSHTLTAERARVRAEKREAREKEIAEYREEFGDDEELPEELRTEPEEPEEAELVEARVFMEEEYAQRVPHPRYQHWRVLEHAVKHANSDTLHTYVLFAGVPYGHGEGPLTHDLLRAAWHHQSLPLYGPGHNVVPMIHVDDLATITYKVGSAYDVFEERYMFAVDRGNLTQKQILQAIQARVGGGVHAVEPDPASDPEMVQLEEAALPRAPTMDELWTRFSSDPHPRLPYFLSDVRAEPSAVLAVHSEDDWVALDGFADSIDKTVFQFREARKLQPLRLVITGPPLSGQEVVAKSVAKLYSVPYLTAESAVAAYKAHGAEVREELRALLVRRLQRRRDRGHARRCREANAELEQQRLALEAAAAEKRNGEDGEEEDDDDDDQDEGEDGDEDRDSAHAGGGSGDSDDVVSELSMVFEEDSYPRSASACITEAHLLGPDVGDDDAERDEELEEDAEAVLDELDVEDEEGPTRAQKRARLAIRATDTLERVRIQELRQEYRLVLKALSMKTVDGRLPRPKDEEAEGGDEEDYTPASAKGHRKGKSQKATGADEDNDEDGGSAEEDEDEEGGRTSDVEEAGGESEKGEEEDEEWEDNAESGGKARGRRAAAAAAHAPVERYLDEAQAFFVRWRLRQADCRNQGYVLSSFPSTVRQACLLYFADTEEELERCQRRVLPAVTADDVPPAADSEFPFAAITDIPEEQLREIEEQIHNDTLRIVDPSEEGVLAPVQESTFPDFVLVVDESDEALQTLAGALESAPGGAAASAAGSGVLAARECAGRSHDGQGKGIGDSCTIKAAVQSDRSNGNIGDAGLQGRDAPQTPVMAPSEIERHEAPIRELANTFYERLSRYRKHHTNGAPPTESLVTWFQCVSTGDTIGATPQPIVLSSAPAGDAKGGEEGGEGEALQQLEPPSTSRMARVVMVQAPTRNHSNMRAEVATAFAIAEEANATASAGLTKRLRSGGRTFDAKHDAERAYEIVRSGATPFAASSSPTPAPEQRNRVSIESENSNGFACKDNCGTLYSFARRLSASLLPAPVFYGPAPNEEQDGGELMAALLREQEILHGLQCSEEKMKEAMQREEEEVITCERRHLRSVQVSEEALGVWESANMPMESYLMKYVLPSLTPVMTEVVKLRPEKPVTVLADLLFQHKRRTEI